MFVVFPLFVCNIKCLHNVFSSSCIYTICLYVVFLLFVCSISDRPDLFRFSTGLHLMGCMAQHLWSEMSMLHPSYCQLWCTDGRTSSSNTLGPGRPLAGGPRWDRRSNTLTHASPRACGARLGGSVWKQGI